jgi:pilus assembly protein CpaD
MLNPKITRTARVALALSLGMAVAGCFGGIPTNRQLESVHQPIVSRTNYALDVTAGPGGLSYAEQRRVADWFAAMNLRYGDRITIDDPMQNEATRQSVAALADRYGIQLGGDAPVLPGHVNAGAARIVITRAKAEVPGCPDWSAKNDGNFHNATSTNYGCATNANLAAMVANPEHLLKGAESQGETLVLSSTKAIESYRATAPSGAGGQLKASSSSGK